MGSKQELFNVNDNIKEIEVRLSQLEEIKSKTPSQKFEIRVLNNHLEDYRRNLANEMFNHDNLDDLIELCGLSKTVE